MQRYAARGRGFTLIEFLVVAVVVAALGAIALPRFQPAETTVNIEADHLARDLRHMQMLAMTWGVTLRFTPAGGSYSVSCASGSATPPCNGASAVVDPATGSSFVVALQNNVTVAGSALDMDGLGRPVAGGALLNADTSYTLTGGSKTASVTVQRLTGFLTMVY